MLMLVSPAASNTKMRSTRMPTRTGHVRKLALFIAVVATTISAQQPTAPAPDSYLATYDIKREITLLGTVQSFIPLAQTPPLGAHLTLQTSSGLVDVHLGDARFLAANHFNITPGDSLRIMGENLTSASKAQFVARIVQNRTHILVLRSIRGTPLSYMAPRTASPSPAHTGAL
jgi:hypothetical protein